MMQVSAQDILDLVTTQTSGSLLARQWQSARLVNVDNETLKRILDDQKALDILAKIEGFRTLNKDIETIINKSEHVKEVKKEGKKLTPEQKEQVSKEEKDYKDARKKIQEKLIKFMTRIPIFMYLTDDREKTLVELVNNLETNLFTNVTSLTLDDFNYLCSLGVFPKEELNPAIWNFKRFEDPSLTYLGLDIDRGDVVGGFNKAITKDEYNKLYYLQEETLSKDVKESIDYDKLKEAEIEKQLQKEQKYSNALNFIKNSDSNESTMDKNSANQKQLDKNNSNVNSTSNENSYFTDEETKLKNELNALVGKRVQHKIHGSGIVTKVDLNAMQLYVHLDSTPKYYKDMVYSYPFTFDKGLIKLIDK